MASGSMIDVLLFMSRLKKSIYTTQDYSHESSCEPDTLEQRSVELKRDVTNRSQAHVPIIWRYL